jgi:UDP-3-O-[3-hydroxymyristoyl] N-acetylglucosamine deacetylase
MSRSGVGLHSGVFCTATLLPARAGDGRYSILEGDKAKVAAEMRNVEPQSQLCTTLRRGDGGGPRVRTVEHLLSAMEAIGVNNCRIEVSGGDEVCSLFLDCNCQFVT